MRFLAQAHASLDFSSHLDQRTSKLGQALSALHGRDQVYICRTGPDKTDSNLAGANSFLRCSQQAHTAVITRPFVVVGAAGDP